MDFCGYGLFVLCLGLYPYNFIITSMLKTSSTFISIINKIMYKLFKFQDVNIGEVVITLLR